MTARKTTEAVISLATQSQLRLLALALSSYSCDIPQLLSHFNSYLTSGTYQSLVSWLLAELKLSSRSFLFSFHTFPRSGEKAELIKTQKGLNRSSGDRVY